jgi:hypothetical protein
MPINRSILLVAGVIWVISALALHAAQNALIIIGTTGDPSIAADLTHAAQTIQASLIRRGFPSDSVEVLGAGADNGTVTSDMVLAALKKRQTLAASDEFWLVLLGFAGRSAEDTSTFQVTGPRLAVADLKTALDAIPARQFVFAGTSDSGNFVPALMQTNRTVLAATRQEGEIDLPRFPEAWAAALKENPKAGWKEIAARAAAMNTQEYASSGLAVGEHAQLGDPKSGTILEAPFGADSVSESAESPEDDDSMALLNASDIKVEIRDPNAEWEKHVPTAETKKLIADASAVPNPDGFNAIMLEQRLGYRIGEDRTAEDFVMQRIYIAREDGVARWANFMLAQDPPAVTTRLVAARIIQPDGSSTVFNPAKMPAATDDSSGVSDALSMIFMPDAHAGCVIEIAYRTRHLLDTSMPEFSEELPVQLDVPVLKTELQLQVPQGDTVHFKLRNSDQKPTDAVVDGMRTLTWKLDHLSAFEPLPYDPPERNIMIALDVSSLDSWDSFATWYKRLARGSDEQDDAVRAKAKELAAGATTRLAKIRRAYEFVSALRYVAIEFGVNGIRPRTPAVVLQNRYGDCKDKANLLIALLTDMGIDARFTVLNRGSSTDVDFPSWQFNHAIAYVPKALASGQPEDLWLDTTDSTAPFPTLSPGDVGCSALVFEPDSAKFLTVTALDKEMATVQENWKFKEDASGVWNSSDTGLEITWSGVAEYGVRSSVRGLSPRQRDFLLQTQLTKLLPNADFTKLTLTPADDLSIPLRLDARVDASPNPPPEPRSGFDIDAYFAPPERNRPLLLNDGQKLHLIQTVEWTYANPPAGANSLSPAFDQNAAGIHATITWKRTSDLAWSRIAELSVDQPLVAQADYATVRHMLRDWADHLSR